MDWVTSLPCKQLHWNTSGTRLEHRCADGADHHSGERYATAAAPRLAALWGAMLGSAEIGVAPTVNLIFSRIS